MISSYSRRTENEFAAPATQPNRISPPPVPPVSELDSTKPAITAIVQTAPNATQSGRPARRPA